MKKSYVAIAVGLAIALGASAGSAAPPPVNPNATAITVFDQPNFRGKSLTFERPVASLAAVKFNDLTASVQIKGKRDWVLCEHRNFFGKCVRIRAKEKNLKRLQFDGKVSSMYPVAVEPTPAPKKP